MTIRPIFGAGFMVTSAGSPLILPSFLLQKQAQRIMYYLAPSILSADFGRLEAHCREAIDAGVTWLHIDVMDGHFVPNITIGPLVVKALERLKNETGVTLDVHLMIEKPDRYLQAFADAGADILTVHTEACTHLHRTVQTIKSLGVKAGVALNPATSLFSLDEILPELDLVLIMTVNPGFGGQSFIPSTLEKVRRLHSSLRAMDLDIYLEVDGGVSSETIDPLVHAGANVLVAGNAIFGGKQSVAENIAALHRAVK